MIVRGVRWDNWNFLFLYPFKRYYYLCIISLLTQLLHFKIVAKAKYI